MYNTSPPPLRFDFTEAARAWDKWGMNCGPGALAGVTGRSLEEVRHALPEFGKGSGKKHYTNAAMMRDALKRLNIPFEMTEITEIKDFLEMIGDDNLPDYGLARIQWDGPWMKPDQPLEVRQRHTHWIGFHSENVDIFDINTIFWGKSKTGWLWWEDWENDIRAPLLVEAEPEAYNDFGRWHVTHKIEINRAILCP